jgi:hypothetical protein
MKMSQIISNLEKTLVAKTQATVNKIIDIENQVREAIAKAEAQANAIIEARLADLEHTIASEVHAFENRLAEATGSAIERAMGTIEAFTIEPATTEPAEPCPIPTYAEYREEAATVAAHAVEQEVACEPEAQETNSPDGLHERQEGQPRSKYILVPNPTPGETYYRRDHRRHWNPVKYTG